MLTARIFTKFKENKLNKEMWMIILILDFSKLLDWFKRSFKKKEWQAWVKDNILC